MALTANDSAERMGQLIALTERLTALIAEQLRAFEAHRPQDAAINAEETAQLANLYRHESLKVRADPSLLAGAPADLREKLIAGTRAFDAVLARHGRAVEAAKTITEGLIRAIAEEVSVQRNAVASYGPKAVQAVRPATAVALNRRA
ncbi:MAG: flbY [Caulobacteraceae bacterium]|nr:flbY [Caulobacteraceae bacterium]